SQTTFGGGGNAGFAYCERPSELVFTDINDTLRSVIRNEAGFRDFDVHPFYMVDSLASVTSFSDPNCPYPGIGRDIFTAQTYVNDRTSPSLFVLLSQGEAFVNFQGHGNATVMTHEELYVAQGGLQDVDLIFNQGMPWVFTGYACHLNNFASVHERGFF